MGVAETLVALLALFLGPLLLAAITHTLKARKGA